MSAKAESQEDRTIEATPFPNRRPRNHLRRRTFVGAAVATMGSALLPGCGAGEEGEDVFTFDVKLLNAAVYEESVTVASAGRTFFDGLAYGEIGTVRLQEDDFVFDADITVRGNSTGTETTLTAVRISPAFFVLLSTAVGRYSLLQIGEVPSPYANEGGTPYSLLRNLTTALGPVDVFALAGTGTQLPKIGMLQPGGSIAIPKEALASYKLAFVQNGTAIYQSGPREKPANSLLLVMRSAPLVDPTSTWGVYLIDSDYQMVRWENALA